jgi:lactoylglutathione lyase
MISREQRDSSKGLDDTNVECRRTDMTTATAQHLFEAHLAVSNLDASVAFYRDVVGLELAYAMPDRQAAFFWIGARGRAMLGVWAAGSAPQKITTHVAFAATLEDVVAAPKALHAAGVVPLDFDGRPTDGPIVIGWMPAACIYFRDPDGHLLEYVAMLSDAPRPECGILSWDAWQRRALNG